jgi:hypothetical protein
MNTRIYTYLLPLLLLAFYSCGGGEAKKERPIARVNSKILYASDLEGIGRGLSAEDSSRQASQYIDKWIEDQLLYDAAEQNIGEKPRITRLVADYRASLILSEYEASLLKEQLDTVVTPQEIADYYTKNKEQYQRGEDWLRCHFIRINRQSADANQLRSLFKDDSRRNVQKIGTIGQNNKATFLLDDTRWVKLLNVSSRLPTDINIDRYLDGTILDRSDDTYIYLLKVFEFRSKNDAAPLQEVQQEIRQVVVYMREQTILRNLRQEIYKNAKADKAFEVF